LEGCSFIGTLGSEFYITRTPGSIFDSKTAVRLGALRQTDQEKNIILVNNN
jgi:hypothetical protein